jgi:hypothetical protein
MFTNVGLKYVAKGYAPNRPVLIIPGMWWWWSMSYRIFSSLLVVRNLASRLSNAAYKSSSQQAFALLPWLSKKVPMRRGLESVFGLI